MNSKYTVFGIDRVTNKRVTYCVLANHPDQAEDLAHFVNQNLLVAAVLKGSFASVSSREDAEPATV
jgi:hypothetical protein